MANLSAGVYISEGRMGTPATSGVSTSATGFIGLAERGPIGEVVPITSWERFREQFGEYQEDSQLAFSVAGYFQSRGASVCYVVRTAHYTNPANAATLTALTSSVLAQDRGSAPTAGSTTGTNTATFAMADSDTLDVQIDGGPTQTSTFTGTAAVINGVGGTWPTLLAGGETITVEVDGGAPQIVTFTALHQTAADVALAINQQVRGLSCIVNAGELQLRSDVSGTDSKLEITAESAPGVAAIIGLVLNTPVSGSGNVADLSEVTISEVASILTGDFTGCTIGTAGDVITITSDTTGATSVVQVMATSVNADDILGFDNVAHAGAAIGAAQDTLTFSASSPGVWGDSLDVVVAEPEDGVAGHFNLEISRDGSLVERFLNLNFDEADDNYVETVINGTIGSLYIRVTDEGSTGVGINRVPAYSTVRSLTGGDDGLTGLDDNDFIGDSSAKTGLRAFDRSKINLVAMPDRKTVACQRALIQYCENRGDCFAIVTSPFDLSPTAVLNYYRNTLNNPSEYAAFYYPNVRISDPLGQGMRTIDPSGHIAGAYARTDANPTRGVYKVAAGIDDGRLFGVDALEFDSDVSNILDPIRDRENLDLLYPARINPITQFEGTSIILWGGRTMSSTGEFPYINERRTIINIEQTILESTRWSQFENNDELLWQKLTAQISAYLRSLGNNLKGKTEKERFYVKIDAETNPASVIQRGETRGKIGVATQKPSEFLMIEFFQFNNSATA